MKRFVALLSVILASQLCLGQGKIYTRKVKLEDFVAKTTKVVVRDCELDYALKDEMSSRWNLSAFEFCSPSQHKALSESTSFYFLFLKNEGGFEVLTLFKGGKTDATDPLKEGFEVVSFPVAPAGGPYEDATLYMPGFVDVLQQFMEDAIQSESAAYSGLAHYNLRKKIFRRTLSGDDARRAFEASEPGALLKIDILPSNPSKGDFVYTMLMMADNHKLYGFSKNKWKQR